MSFTFVPQKLPGIVLIQPDTFKDKRGSLVETYRASAFRGMGIGPFVQENHSVSRKGVLRGLHFQHAPYAQGKLLSVVSGSVYDVAVDIRSNSKTFGQHVGIKLSATPEGSQYFWIPPGFAHGFQALEDRTIVVYKLTSEYSPENAAGINYTDPELGIQWPLPPEETIVLEKDRDLPTLKRCLDLAGLEYTG